MPTTTKTVDLVETLIARIDQAVRDAKVAAEKAAREEFERQYADVPLYVVFLCSGDESFNRGVFTRYEEAISQLTESEIRHVRGLDQDGVIKAVIRATTVRPTKSRPVIVQYPSSPREGRYKYRIELASPEDVVKWVDQKLIERSDRDKRFDRYCLV